MPKNKRNAKPINMFDAQLAFETLGMLFEHIAVQLRQAEDGAGYTPGASPYFAAIEALAEKGVRECKELEGKVVSARNAEREVLHG